MCPPPQRAAECAQLEEVSHVQPGLQIMAGLGGACGVDGAWGITEESREEDSEVMGTEKKIPMDLERTVW